MMLPLQHNSKTWMEFLKSLTKKSKSKKTKSQFSNGEWTVLYVYLSLWCSLSGENIRLCLVENLNMSVLSPINPKLYLVISKTSLVL